MLHDTLVDVYPILFVDKACCRLMDRVLPVFFKYLQSIDVITSEMTQMLAEQLHADMPELICKG